MSEYAVKWGLDAEEPERPRERMTREADYITECLACEEQILPGDTITIEDGDWVHESCADD